MKSKMTLALAGLLTILLVSFAPVPVSAPVGPQSHNYVVMGGLITTAVQFSILPPALWQFPTPTRAPYITPMQFFQDVEFAPPQQIAANWWVVSINVPAATYKGWSHIAYSGNLGYLRLTTFLAANGSGVIHVGPGAMPDVDYFVFNNYSGVYFLGADMTPNTADDFLAGTAMMPLNPAAAGLDGIPGTRLGGPIGPDPTDQFGDGVPDPPGSSILVLPLVFQIEAWNGTAWTPTVLTAPAPTLVPLYLIMTTGIASDIVVQPGCLLNGLSYALAGFPWQFHASGAQWDDTVKSPKANVKVGYANVWSLLTNFPVGTGIDLLYAMFEEWVRSDEVIADINMDQTVNIVDIVTAITAIYTVDEGTPAPGWYTPADATADLNKTGQVWWYGPMPPYWYPVASPFATYPVSGWQIKKYFDPRADLNGDGKINVNDIVRIAIDFGKTIDP